MIPHCHCGDGGALPLGTANRKKTQMDLFNKKKVERLEKRIDELSHNSVLVMTDKEREEYDKFFKEHFHKHATENYGDKWHLYKNAVPGWQHIVRLIPTSIAMGIEIECPICGAHKDITDYARW